MEISIYTYKLSGLLALAPCADHIGLADSIRKTELNITINDRAYQLAGLRIVSDLLLPGVPSCPDELLGADSIRIRRGKVPETLAAPKARFAGGECDSNEFLFEIPGVARFLVRGGHEIIIQPAANEHHGDICAYLLGTMFGMLCHQRGIMPLHASAIDVSGGCVAFVGESGAGKSTLVAALAARGHQVMADDVCFLRLGNKGDARVWPGINRLRLWEDAMAALGCDGPGVERVWSGYNKYLIPIRPLQCPTEPRCLRRIYQLHAASERGSFGITRLHGAAAMEALIQNVYRLNLAETMGYKPAAFAVCAVVAQDVPAFQFSRPIGFDSIRQGVEILEAHLCDLC